MTVRHIWPALVAGIILVLSPTLVHAVSPVAASTAGRAHAGKAAAACPPGSRASGTVRFSDWQFPDTLNPYQTGRVMTRQITNALFASLFRYDNRGRLAPQMAAAVPTTGNGGITDGGRTITVRLRQGLRWSNGAEITSRDIWFGWRVGMDNATGPACLGTCDAIARIDTPGRYTAVIRLKAPYAAAVSDAMPDVWPHVWPGAWNDNPKAAARKLGLDPSFNFESPRFPTSGAYQVATFVKDKSISLRPAPYCGGAIKNLTFVAYDTKRDLIDAAASKKTDLTTDYNLADLAELNKHNAYRVRVQTSFTLEHLELNLDRTYGNKPNPLADVRVRQALALALDKSALVQSALQVGKKAAAGYAAWSPFVNAPDLKQPFVTAFPSGQWDPISGKFVTPGTRAAVADAQRLLKGTPYKNGFSLDLYTTSESVIRQLEEGSIAASWEKLKVKLVPNFVSDASLLGSWADGGIATRGKFQVALFSYLGSPDPDGYRFNLAGRYCNRSARVHSTLNGNNSCVHDALIDRSFADAARNLDPARRAADYNAVAAQVNKQAYWIPLYFRPTVVTDDGRVANVSLNPTPLGLTWNVDAWRVRGA